MASIQQNKAFANEILCQYPLDEAISYIQKNMRPEDIFDKNQLGRWAIENGYWFVDDENSNR